MMVVALVAVVALAGGGIFLATRNNNQNLNATATEEKKLMQTEETQESSAQDEEVIEEEEEMSGPIAFSEIGKGIMDAREDFQYFTFENGAGTCMDQNFPKDLIYGPDNYISTMDGTYGYDYTGVDFLGNISFGNLPLSTGSAYCVMSTSSDSNIASVTCSVDDVEVCTADFDLFGIK